MGRDSLAVKMGDSGVLPVDAALRLKEKVLYTFDDIIRQRAVDEDQSPLITYPKTRLGVTDYELFTGRQLNRLVDGAAKALIKAGFDPVVRTCSVQFKWRADANPSVQYEDAVAGIYGTSNLDYIITIFALGRLGYTTFILSPRLPVNACVSLLKGANSSILLHAPQFLDLATKISREIPLKLGSILHEANMTVQTITAPFSSGQA